MRQQRRIYEIDFEYHKMRMQHNFKLMTNNNLPFDMGSGGQGPMPSFGQVPALGYGYDQVPALGQGYDQVPALGYGYDQGPALGQGYDQGPAGQGYDQVPALGYGYDQGPAGQGFDQGPAGQGYDQGPAGQGPMPDIPTGLVINTPGMTVANSMNDNTFRQVTTIHSRLPEQHEEQREQREHMPPPPPWQQLQLLPPPPQQPLPAAAHQQLQQLLLMPTFEELEEDLRWIPELFSDDFPLPAVSP